MRASGTVYCHKVADGFPFFNEISSEGALVRAQFGQAAEGDAACLSGAPSFLGSGGDQRAFELRDACEHGEHHTPSRGHRHINFLGRYAFTLPEAVARGELRPLRHPGQGWLDDIEPPAPR